MPEVCVRGELVVKMGRNCGLIIRGMERWIVRRLLLLYLMLVCCLLLLLLVLL